MATLANFMGYLVQIESKQLPFPNQALTNSTPLVTNINFLK